MALVLGGVKREMVFREIGCTGEGSVVDVRPVPAMAPTPGPTQVRATAKAPSEDDVTATPPLRASSGIGAIGSHAMARIPR